MPQYDGSGRPLNNTARLIAAGQTTAQLSVSADNTRGRDYLERVVITQASTLGGVVTVFDGTIAMLALNAQVTGYTGPNVHNFELNIVSDTTKGFNVTTGASVSCLCVGRFGG